MDSHRARARLRSTPSTTSHPPGPSAAAVAAPHPEPAAAERPPDSSRWRDAIGASAGEQRDLVGVGLFAGAGRCGRRHAALRMRPACHHGDPPEPYALPRASPLSTWSTQATSTRLALHTTPPLLYALLNHTLHHHHTFLLLLRWH